MKLSKQACFSIMMGFQKVMAMAAVDDGDEDEPVVDLGTILDGFEMSVGEGGKLYVDNPPIFDASGILENNSEPIEDMDGVVKSIMSDVVLSEPRDDWDA